MTITLEPDSTVMFTGDSITSLWRPAGTDRCGYPALVAGEWCFRNPDRPLTWLNTGYRGDKVPDLEARWQEDVLDAHSDVLSILIGANDNHWHTLDPDGRVISAEEFAAGYDRLLAPLAAEGTELILIEPFLLPVHDVTEAAGVRIDAEVRAEWRHGLNPKIQAVRELAHEYGAQLLAADSLFTGLAATTGPERWSEDGIHLTPAGHSALAEAWLRLVE